MRFFLVDKVLELEEGKRLKAIKNVTLESSYLEQHFPGNPIFPGVLVTEAMAQASGYLISKTLRRDEGRDAIAIMTGNNSRFLQLVQPGDQLVMEVGLALLDSNFAKTRVQSRVNGEVVARAELTFAVTDYERTRYPEMSKHWQILNNLLDAGFDKSWLDSASDQSGAEQGKSDHGKTDQGKIDQGKADD